MLKHLVYVGGVALPEPSSYESNTATIVDSARNLDGYVVGAVIRSNVAKVSLMWRFLRPEQWANILALFNASFYNNVEFFDQATGAWVTKRMYVGDRSASMFRRNPDITHISDPLQDYPVVGWKDCKLALVEV